MTTLETAIVLVRPTEEGNIGAAARAMANMGLSRLVIVEPATPIRDTARAFAVHAGEVLDKAVHAGSFAEGIAPFQRVVGTTSKRARTLEVPLISPRELPRVLASDPAGTSTAIVFGPERSGLENDELARLSPLVRIPTSRKQPTLNLAQAVLLVAWELYHSETAAVEKTDLRSEPVATAADIEGLFGQLTPLLGDLGFARDDTFSSVLRDLRRLAARARLTDREVRILRGICRRAARSVSPKPPQAGRER
ncbi:MAG: TrmJ/YjtD family RNA methyltransferase [Acidobacteriota bacterium]|nr:TrmJ/YjtD family RNA methyltransferase [Acidobacteriota bacterium]